MKNVSVHSYPLSFVNPIKNRIIPDIVLIGFRDMGIFWVVHDDSITGRVNHSASVVILFSVTDRDTALEKKFTKKLKQGEICCV